MNTRGPKSGYRKTIMFRRKLRHDITPAEMLFWSKVRSKKFLGLKFRKQHGIGNYVVDFYCSEKNLIVEIDGDSHADDNAQVSDDIRSNYLEALGYKVIRYNNRDVLNNTEGVFEDLIRKIEQL